MLLTEALRTINYSIVAGVLSYFSVTILLMQLIFVDLCERSQLKSLTELDDLLMPHSDFG